MAKKWSEEFEQHNYDFNALEQEMDVPVEDKVIPHMQKSHIMEEGVYITLYDGKRIEDFTIEDSIAYQIDTDIALNGKVLPDLEEAIEKAGYSYSFEGEKIIVSPLAQEETNNSLVYLRLPSMEREEFLKVTQQLKEDGAKFNPYIKKWYVPPGVDKSKFQEYIPQKNGSNAHENVRERQIVKLTGLPVSDEMQDILNTLERGEYVEIDRIKNTEEMKIAYSHINYATPTILLDGRQAEQANFARMLLDKGSATLDKNGKTNYDGIVDRKSHLDIVIGLPASGKSSAIVDTISNEFHSRVIDNDEVKKMIPEFNNGWGASVVHEESQIISDWAYKYALKQGDNIVLPKVGGDADKLLHQYIMPAINAGYTVNLHYVELDREKALGRMINRFITDGRFLDPRLIDKYCNHTDGNKIDKCFEQLKNSDYISGYSKWNNDVEYGKKPIIAEYHNLETNYIASATQKKEEQKNGRENGNWKRNRSSVDIRDDGSGRGGQLQSTISDRERSAGRESFDGKSGRVVSSNPEVLYRSGDTTGNYASDGRGNLQIEGGNSEGRNGYESHRDGFAGVVSSNPEVLSVGEKHSNGREVGAEQEKNNIARAINRTQKFQANRPLVENIYSLNKLTGKAHSVEDLAKAYKSGSYQDNPDADKLIKDIGKEFIRQEQVRAIAP